MYFYGDCIEMDIFILETLLDIELEGYSTGTARKQMFKNGFGSTLPQDVLSITYGHTFRGYISKSESREPSQIYKSMFKTKIYSEKPFLMEVFKEFAEKYIPDYQFTEVQINKNFRSPPHYDKGNKGDSYIIGFGDYEDGELVIKEKPHDIKGKFLKFDGAKNLHYVNHWKGNRWSLVFYNLEKKKI